MPRDLKLAWGDPVMVSFHTETDRVKATEKWLHEKWVETHNDMYWNALQTIQAYRFLHEEDQL